MNAPTRPHQNLPLAHTLTLSLLAAISVAVLLGVGWQPKDSVAVVLLTAPPMAAVVAVTVLAAYARAFGDRHLGWFSVGLGSAAFIMTLQLVAVPLVSMSGGPLGTSPQSQAALNLAFHLALACGALLATARIPMAAVLPVVAVGVLGSLMLATDTLTMTPLLDGADFTTAMRAAAAAIAGITLLAASLWVRAVGAVPSGLHAWSVAALLLSACDQLALAASEGSMTPWWWASLTLRTCTYLLLAAGVLTWLLSSLVTGEVWTRHELERRDDELEVADALNRQLLAAAEQLSLAVEVPEVRHAAARLALEGTRATDAWLVGHPGAAEGAGAGADKAAAIVASVMSAGSAASPFVSDDEAGGACLVFPVRIDGPDGPDDPDSGALAHLVVTDERARAWGARDLQFMTGLAHQVGLALSRAHAYDAVSTAAATLQASLRPDRHLEINGVRLHTAYRPATAGHEVGGDWFDAIAVDEHRSALVIGDVMGKGWRAAAVMGQVRTALRSAALLGLGPAAALDTLDSGVIDLHPDEIITVLFAVVDHRTGRLGVARAGHPPALVLDHAGCATFLEDGGSPPVGLVSGSREETWIAASEVSRLVLFTDGVVETRTTDVELGMAGLADHARRLALEERSRGDAQVWDDWLEELRTRADWQDDVAVMVACLDDVGSVQATPDQAASRRVIPGHDSISA